MAENTGVLDAKTIRMATRAIPKQHTGNTGRTAETPLPKTKERVKQPAANVFAETKSVPGVSIFAILGTIAVSALMVFVVLAQINYNETASESVRLSVQLRELTETHRTLTLAFESSFDIREVERIAKDELGMSVPEAEQILTITVPPRDTATVIIGEKDEGVQGFAEFLKSLTDYFR